MSRCDCWACQANAPGPVPGHCFDIDGYKWHDCDVLDREDRGVELRRRDKERAADMELAAETEALGMFPAPPRSALFAETRPAGA